MSLLAALLVASAVQTVPPTRLPPVEQCADQDGFANFRKLLVAGVAARDMDRLTALMSDDVHVSFGGRFGKKQFAAYWTKAAGRQADLWTQMDAVLALGCATARDGRGVEYRSFPALFVTAGPLDGFSTSVALPGAILRGRPSATARVVMRVPAWTVLGDRVDDGGAWIEATTPKGRRGYLLATQTRSIIDYRLIVGKRAGQWRITAFVAGD